MGEDYRISFKKKYKEYRGVKQINNDRYKN